jgi:hypothetical protein
LSRLFINGKSDAVHKRRFRSFIIDLKTSANLNALRLYSAALIQNSAGPGLQSVLYGCRFIAFSRHTKKPGERGSKHWFLLLGMTQVNGEIEVPLFPKEGVDSEPLSAML